MRKWHVETQIYIGAFQYLFQKQREHDELRNENNAKSTELNELLILARNLLCEIETAINNTRHQMPTVLTRKTMDQKLTFRNNNNVRLDFGEIDDLDNKFTKVRFTEYLHNLEKILKRPAKKSLNRRNKNRNNNGNQMNNNNNNNKNNRTSINSVNNRIKKVNRNGEHRLVIVPSGNGFDVLHPTGGAGHARNKTKINNNNNNSINSGNKNREKQNRRRQNTGMQWTDLDRLNNLNRNQRNRTMNQNKVVRPQNNQNRLNLDVDNNQNIPQQNRHKKKRKHNRKSAPLPTAPSSIPF